MGRIINIVNGMTEDRYLHVSLFIYGIILFLITIFIEIPIIYIINRYFGFFLGRRL